MNKSNEHRPAVLDLFAGIGVMPEGFRTAGPEVVCRCIAGAQTRRSAIRTGDASGFSNNTRMIPKTYKGDGE